MAVASALSSALLLRAKLNGGGVGDIPPVIDPRGAGEGWNLALVLADVKKSGGLGPQTQLKAVEATRGETPLDFDFDRRSPKPHRFRDFFYSRNRRQRLLVVKPAGADGNSVRLDEAQVRELDRIARHYSARPAGEVRWWAQPVSEDESDEHEDIEPEEPPIDERAQRLLRRQA